MERAELLIEEKTKRNGEELGSNKRKEILGIGYESRRRACGRGLASIELIAVIISRLA